MATLQRVYKFLLKNVLKNIIQDDLSLKQFSINLFERNLHITNIALKKELLNTRFQEWNIPLFVEIATVGKLSVDKDWNFTVEDLDLTVVYHSYEDVKKPVYIMQSFTEHQHTEIEKLSNWIDDISNNIKITVSNIIIRFKTYIVKIDNILCYNTDENTKCVDIAGLRIMRNGTNIYISKNKESLFKVKLKLSNDVCIVDINIPPACINLIPDLISLERSSNDNLNMIINIHIQELHLSINDVSIYVKEGKLKISNETIMDFNGLTIKHQDKLALCAKMPLHISQHMRFEDTVLFIQTHTLHASYENCSFVITILKTFFASTDDNSFIYIFKFKDVRLVYDKLLGILTTVQFKHNVLSIEDAQFFLNKKKICSAVSNTLNFDDNCIKTQMLKSKLTKDLLDYLYSQARERTSPREAKRTNWDLKWSDIYIYLNDHDILQLSNVQLLHSSHLFITVQAMYFTSKSNILVHSKKTDMSCLSLNSSENRLMITLSNLEIKYSPLYLETYMNTFKNDNKQGTTIHYMFDIHDCAFLYGINGNIVCVESKSLHIELDTISAVYIELNGFNVYCSDSQKQRYKLLKLNLLKLKYKTKLEINTNAKRFSNICLHICPKSYTIISCIIASLKSMTKSTINRCSSYELLPLQHSNSTSSRWYTNVGNVEMITNYMDMCHVANEPSIVQKIVMNNIRVLCKVYLTRENVKHDIEVLLDDIKIKNSTLYVRDISVIDCSKYKRYILKRWEQKCKYNNIVSIYYTPLSLKIIILPVHIIIRQQIIKNLLKAFKYEGEEQKSFYKTTITIMSIDLRIDYNPEIIPTTFKDAMDIMSIIPLEDLQLTLCHIYLQNKTITEIVEATVTNWYQDILSKQLGLLVKGVGISPLKSIANIGVSMTDLIILPIVYYKRNGNVLLGLKYGATSIVKSVAVETLRTINTVTCGTRKVLDKVQQTVSNKKQTLKREHPSNLNEGFKQAYDSMAKGLCDASEYLIIPLEKYKQNGTKSALKSTIQTIPVATLAPIIGAADGLSKILIGAKEQFQS